MRTRHHTALLFFLMACLATPGTPARAAEETEDTAEETTGTTEEAPAAETSEPEPVDLEALEKDRAAKAVQVTPRISRYLGAAAEEVDAGNPDEASQLLEKLNPKRLSAFERALVYRMLAYVAYGSQDTEGAIRNFERVLEQEALPIRDEARVRFNIAQLHASVQNWDQVIRWLKEWLRYTTEPDPLGFYLMAVSYYQKSDYESAIESAKKAVELSTTPREAWLRLLAALYSANQDYDNATPVLEELVLRFPKKGYWVQLSLIYGARKEYQRSLAVQQVAHGQGLLTEEKELLRLTRSYLYADLPFPAAKVLSSAIDEGAVDKSTENLELLANSWITAREYDRSLPPLRSAADMSDSGDLYVRLGQVHMQREEWEEAAALLQKAVAKGGLKNEGNAVLLLGIAYYNAKLVDPARTSFERARGYEATRAEAERWITHIETEQANAAG